MSELTISLSEALRQTAKSMGLDRAKNELLLRFRRNKISVYAEIFFVYHFTLQTPTESCTNVKVQDKVWICLGVTNHNSVNWNYSRLFFTSAYGDSPGDLSRGIEEYRHYAHNYHRLYILQSDIDREFKLSSKAVSILSKGGRPSKWDWEGAFIEMARVAALGDSCDRKTLSDAVHEWFIAQTGSHPAGSDIRAKVKRFHEGIWPPKAPPKT